jgi:hypothetical protein
MRIGYDLKHQQALAESNRISLNPKYPSEAVTRNRGDSSDCLIQ